MQAYVPKTQQILLSLLEEVRRAQGVVPAHTCKSDFLLEHSQALQECMSICTSQVFVPMLHCSF